MLQGEQQFTNVDLAKTPLINVKFHYRDSADQVFEETRKYNFTKRI